MLSKMKKTALAVGAGVSALVVSGQAAAQAASILPADFDTTMGGVSTDITTVGGALIGLAVVAVGIKWVKGTFFS